MVDAPSNSCSLHGGHCSVAYFKEGAYQSENNKARLLQKQQTGYGMTSEKAHTNEIRGLQILK